MSATTKSLRCLIVEDVEDDAQLMLRQLRAAGYDVTWERVDTPEAMRAALEHQPWDVVLSDYRMPRFSGLEAFELLRTSGRDLPFIIVSGTIGEETAVAAMKAGVGDYLIKGQLDHLPVAVERELRHAATRRERKVADAALRRTEARQRAMVANIGDVIVIIDQDGINRYKSPNIEKWFGWRPEDVVGVSALDNVHPEDKPQAQKFIGDLLSAPNAPGTTGTTGTTGTPGTPGTTGTTECRYRCKNGDYKWISFTAVNLLHDSNIQGLLGNYHDITGRKEAEVERVKLETQFQQAQKMEAVGRLAGGVAHDFNNMLQAILGNVDLALEGVPLGSPTDEGLREIRRCAERSADLTRQLLAFARRQTIAPKVLDLNATVESLLKMMRRLIGENIDLAWLPARDLGLVKVDPTQVDQILANLCVNARDAIGGVGKVTIETANAAFDAAYCVDHPGYMAGEYVRLKVSDNGCGMDQATKAQIFEPFFTTKGNGAGTGLGLATVYGIVKQNRGFINVYSEPDHGSTFTLYLPRHEGQATAARTADVGVMPRSFGETVLLVEDEPAVVAIARMILERLGYTVLAASTPGEAIRLGETHVGEIYLLITDVVMPEMNGRDLNLRLLAIRPKLKCLFMSGYTADVLGHNGVLEAGVRFLQKPFSMGDLATKVRRTLDDSSVPQDDFK
jgi:signal transduction histidine kinase/DNA-binding response OmpR family regulator